MIVAMPARTPALVPGPVIMKASNAPLLAPPDISEVIIGIEDDPFTYSGKPITASSGTATLLPEPRYFIIKAAGIYLLIINPMAANTAK